MSIVRDGKVTSGTRKNLVEGVRSSPMPEAAVDAVFVQAAAFTDRLVEAYEEGIATGEVGAGGSGRASEEPIIGAAAPRALLYGRVQSGKTVSMILSAALCLDNGFRIVVVLTTDNVALVKQTADRFKDLDGPRVFSAVKDGPSYEWEGQEEVLRGAVAVDGLVLVCAKNAFNLPQVIRFLVQLDASTCPVLVLDDEADAATPDTTLAARSAAKANAPSFASRMNRLIIANDRPTELGFSLGEELPHSMFVQVTATPYVLFLQRESSSIRPRTTFLLEPGEGYCGGEVFFGEFDPSSADAEQPKTIVLVGTNEAALMKRAAPPGLARSLDFFILASCAFTLNGPWPEKGLKHLSHTSHRTDEHELVAGYIAAHLNGVRDVFRSGSDGGLAYFADAYLELSRSLENCPPLNELLPAMRSAMRQTEVHRINSKADSPSYGPRLNFLVGGNILGRGLTIGHLLVTYYIREAKVSQMDTVWQHARMFGYRRAYLDYSRIYLPRQLATRFQQIHIAEEALRKGLEDDDNAAAVLIHVSSASRPTRPNALEAGAVTAVQAGRPLFPHFVKTDLVASELVLSLLQAEGVPIEASTTQSRATQIPLASAFAIIEAIAVDDDDPGLWDAATVTALMRSFDERIQGGCFVYVRSVDGMPPPEGWWRGRLSGPEVALIRTASSNAPALALLYTGEADAPTGWYPTLVTPSDSPTFVFSGV